MVDISNLSDEEITKIESKLFKTYSQMVAIINSSDDAIISMSLDNKILTWNRGARTIYGYGLEELIGKDINVLCSPSRNNEMSELIQKVINNEPVRNYATDHIGKNGKTINILLTLSPIKNEADKTYSLSMISRDVTEQRIFEKKLTKYDEIDRMNRFMVDREIKMTELKKQIGELKDQLEAARKNS